MIEQHEIPGYEGQVSCGYCKNSLPRTQAFQPEAEEYVMYFCGLECYEAWREANRQEQVQDSGNSE